MTRKLLMALIVTLITTAFCAAQNLKDKMYFDQKWNVVQTAGEASFYRMYNASDKSTGQKLFRDYYMSGVLQSEGHYLTMCKTTDKETVFDGKVTFYNQQGKKTSEATYKKSVPHGTVNDYDPETGNMIQSREFRDGEVISSKEYDEFGQLINEYTLNDDGSVKLTEYYYNDYTGELTGKFSGPISEEGVKNGIWEFQGLIDNKWQVTSRETYAQGMRNGPATHWDFDHNSMSEGNFSDDEEVGVWTYTYFDDKYKQVVNYDAEDEPVRFYTFDGKPFSGKHTEKREIGEDEDPDEADDVMTIVIKNSYLQETIFSNSKTGKVVRTIKYQNGRPIDE